MADQERIRPAISSSEYVRWWARYEEAALAGGQSPDKELIAHAQNARFLFSSPRPRAVHTAQLLAGERDIHIDDVFVECPLPLPDLPSLIRLSPRSWGGVSRLIWLLGYSGGQETARQSQLRAKRAAQILLTAAESGTDTVLIAHGWFNRTLHKHIVKAGWKRKRAPRLESSRTSNAYWGHRLYERSDR